MINLTRATLVACGVFTIAVSSALPAVASDSGIVSFRCASADAGCNVEIRLGTLDSPDQAAPYGSKHIDKDSTWDVDSGGLYVFYKGKDGSWQRVAGNRDSKIDL